MLFASSNLPDVLLAIHWKLSEFVSPQEFFPSTKFFDEKNIRGKIHSNNSVKFYSVKFHIGSGTFVCDITEKMI